MGILTLNGGDTDLRDVVIGRQLMESAARYVDELSKGGKQRSRDDDLKYAKVVCEYWIRRISLVGNLLTMMWSYC